MNEKIKIKIFCYECKHEEETSCVVNCRKCNSARIGIEPSEDFHRLSRLWALFKGFEDRVDPFSLAQWFSLNPQFIEQWTKFKHRLITPESIPLPYPPRDRERFEDQTLFSSTTEAYRHWWCFSGILSLHSGQAHEYGVGGIAWMVAEPIVKSFRRDYPFLEKTAMEFVNYCQAKGLIR